VANNTNQAIIIDAVGNITNDGLRQYKYTAGNQLSSVLSAGKTTAYSYDVNNRRVSKTSGTSSTAYIYAEDIGEGSTALSASSLLGEYTANNSNITSKEYIYLGDTPIAVVQAGNILTVQTDHLDTPRQLTDNTKKIVWNWAYSAFGENQPTTTNNTVFNLRYPGQYYDAESKLHYNINRYYDPATGRYTQSDPIGLSGGINTYTYVGGNSIKWSDAKGLQFFTLTTIESAKRNTTIDDAVRAGALTRSITIPAITAALVPSAIGIGSSAISPLFCSTTTTVTSWAPAGVTPDLAVGRWVMKGQPTFSNYVRTGIWGPRVEWHNFVKGGEGFSWPNYPMSNSITGTATIGWPSGVANSWRGLFGQRVVVK
jgi:RHS repeat-associated protein